MTSFIYVSGIMHGDPGGAQRGHESNEASYFCVSHRAI